VKGCWAAGTASERLIADANVKYCVIAMKILGQFSATIVTVHSGYGIATNTNPNYP
jgi:hypothetical protein